MQQSSKQRDIEIALAKRQQREMMAALYKAIRCKNWQPAPPDPGIIPGGIRDRAIKAMNHGNNKSEG